MFEGLYRSDKSLALLEPILQRDDHTPPNTNTPTVIPTANILLIFLLTDDCAGTVIRISMVLSGLLIICHDQIFIVNFRLTFFIKVIKTYIIFYKKI